MTTSKTNNTKQNVREHIIAQASDLFFHRGIKDVKMDDIAHEIGISKRTVYELFADKEELLHESLKYIYKNIHRTGRQKIRETSNNTLDVLLTLYYIYFEMLKKANKNFFLDLKRYPKITEYQKTKEKRSSDKFKKWIQKGVKEGLFREDANSDIILYILRRDIEYITISNEFSNYSIDELGRSFILFYLRGIATSKGQEIIENFIKKQKQ
ncbi:MAG: TetR/AcrR family transcriptional regulator [Bacteroidaceae bacterium]|nr:TetR/AcrR family transcriptional regulator [Bacteroidaceae bacterium]